MIFRKRISPYNVTDTVDFFDGEKTLKLTVKKNAGELVVGIRNAYKLIMDVNDDTDEKAKAEAARALSTAIFGQEHGDRLCAFYRDPLAVIAACGAYFDDRLGKKITKVQKSKKPQDGKKK